MANEADAGPARDVRDSGRRSARGAIIWRAGNGPRPTPEHLTPKDAEAQLDAILRELEAVAELPEPDEQQATLADALYGSIAERERDKGLKRSTLAGYNAMTERMYRDLGADTPLRDFADGRLRAYFAGFKSYKVSSGEDGEEGRRAEGKEVRPVEVERWDSAAARQPSESRSRPRPRPCSLADEMPGTWKRPAAAAPTASFR